MRFVAMLFGTVTVIGSLVQIVAAGFVMTFCDENCGPPVRSVVFWPVMGAAAFVAITAVFFVVSVAFGVFRYAATGLAVHFIAAAGLLAVWLHESHASDGRLLAYFLAFEGCAVAALILCATDQRTRPARTSRAA